MATVVFVHGIAQEQLSADSMEAVWLPALAGGVRIAGNHQLADELWRDARPGGMTTRMAFYGDCFLTPGSQGTPPALASDPQAQDMVQQLAEAWLRNAAEHADDPRDRAAAERELAALNLNPPGRQGPRAALRPAMNGLARLRSFAPFGAGLAGKFVDRALSQVARYLTDDTIRSDVQDRVLSLIDESTRLVIGHSLGSVVAYEALHRTHHPVALLTLGSPLGLRTIVYDRLHPQPPHVPTAVTRWDNLVDRDDLVAAHLDLAPYFPPAADRSVRPVTHEADNGSKPHDATHYLTKPHTGRIVSRSWQHQRTSSRYTARGPGIALQPWRPIVAPWALPQARAVT